MTHDRLRRCFWLVILIALLHLGVHAQQSCTPPPHGMVGWWSGDGNYKDLVGGKDGTPIGSMTFGTGEVGQAFSLDGTNSIRAADSPALNLGAGEITLDAWIKAPPYNGVNDVRTIVAKSNPSYPYQIYFLRVRGDNRVEFAATDCGTLDCGWNGEPGSGYPKEPVRSNTVVADGTFFHHVAGIRRSNGIREIWVDGVLEKTRVESNWNADTSNPLYIGEEDGGGGYRFVGVIDEVEVFNRALDASEIGAIFTAGSAGKCKGCQVSLPHIRKQNDSLWGSHPYDHQYMTCPQTDSNGDCINLPPKMLRPSLLRPGTRS